MNKDPMLQFFLGLAWLLAIMAVIVTVLALLVAGLLLGFAWISDAPLQAMNSAMENLGVGTLTDLRLPALWAQFSPYVYTCASVAALSLVLLFVVRPRKKTHPVPTEGTH